MRKFSFLSGQGVKCRLAALALVVSILGCSGSRPESELGPNEAVVENSDGSAPTQVEDSASGEEETVTSPDPASEGGPEFKALKEGPEFNALTMFAKQDYTQAAKVIRALGVSYQCWHHASMGEFYDDPDEYAGQLKSLEKYVRANPKEADAHFLLAYHYMKNGDSEAAAKEMQQVVTLMPADRLAGGLLKMIQRNLGSPPVAKKKREEEYSHGSWGGGSVVGNLKSKPVHVQAYKRKDGTEVKGHDRSRPHPR
jgi:tetratricopeptide (TPR) repeat protein